MAKSYDFIPRSNRANLLAAEQATPADGAFGPQSESCGLGDLRGGTAENGRWWMQGASEGRPQQPRLSGSINVNLGLHAPPAESTATACGLGIIPLLASVLVQYVHHVCT